MRSKPSESMYHSGELNDNDPFPKDEDDLASSIPFHPPPRLPKLTTEPRTTPDACLSLSIPLLNAISACLPSAPSLTLSIGSGTGLVEALLQQLPQQHQPSSSSSSSVIPFLNLVSVEVAPSPNKYHAPHRTVPGTWALDLTAMKAAAWLFVYPKQLALVRAYVAMLPLSADVGGSRGPETVVYVGPRRDWEEDFRGALEGVGGPIEVWSEERMEAVGGRAWECVAVVRRSVK